MIRLVVAVWLVLALVASGRAWGHDLRPGVLSLVETGRGEYDLRFVAPIDSRGDVVEVTIELPPGCVQRDDRVRCADELSGTLAVHGMRGEAMRTLVQLERLDGERGEWILSAAAPRISLESSPPRTWLPWVRLGVEHILGGLDHLAFVIGLLLVLDLAFDRRLLLAISAFTVAHSLTLALAVLGMVHVPIAPVEACIAASVLLVAREATHRDPTVVRRWPWLAAGGFGLIHGLGFAGALGEIGIARAAVASRLVWFNVGVELGQLAVVGAVMVLAWVGRRLFANLPWFGRRVHHATCYVLGTLAAWWLVERVVAVAS